MNKSALTSPRIKRPRQLTIQQRLLYFSLPYSQVGSLPEAKEQQIMRLTKIIIAIVLTNPKLTSKTESACPGFFQWFSSFDQQCVFVDAREAAKHRRP